MSLKRVDNNIKRRGDAKFSAQTEAEVRDLIVKDARKGFTSAITAARVNKQFGELILNGGPISSNLVRTWRLEELRAAQARLDAAADVSVTHQLMMVRESLSVIADRVQEGDLAAIDRQLKLMDHEARLLGLYEPVKVTGGGSVIINLQGINPDPLAHGVRVSADLRDGIKPSRVIEASADASAGVG